MKTKGKIYQADAGTRGKRKLLKDLDKTVLKAAVEKSLLNGVKILAGELKSNQICGRLLSLEQIDRYLDSLIEDHAASVGKILKINGLWNAPLSLV